MHTNKLFLGAALALLMAPGALVAQQDPAQGQPPQQPLPQAQDSAGQMGLSGLEEGSIEKLLGMPVFDAEGQKLGEVEDIVFESETGRAKHAILASGGLLGLGGRQVAVDLRDLHVEEDHLLTTTITRASIEDMEEYRYPDDAMALSRDNAPEQRDPATAQPQQ